MSQNKKNQIQSLMEQGKEHLDREECLKAIQIYNQVLDLDSDNCKTLAKRSLCHNKLGEYVKAEQDLNMAFQKIRSIQKVDDEWKVKQLVRSMEIRIKLKKLTLALHNISEIQAIGSQKIEFSIEDQIGLIQELIRNDCNAESISNFHQIENQIQNKIPQQGES